MKKWTWTMITIVVILSITAILFNPFELQNTKPTSGNHVENKEEVTGPIVKAEVKGIWVNVHYLFPVDIHRFDVDLITPEVLRSNHAIYLQLDTHSGNLKSYDLKEISRLVFPNGKQIKASEWLSIMEQSHHRHGILLYPKVEDSTELPISLVIDNLAGERFEAKWKTN